MQYKHLFARVYDHTSEDATMNYGRTYIVNFHNHSCFPITPPNLTLKNKNKAYQDQVENLPHHSTRKSCYEKKAEQFRKSNKHENVFTLE